jgi:hypothetical protein
MDGLKNKLTRQPTLGDLILIWLFIAMVIGAAVN